MNNEIGNLHERLPLYAKNKPNEIAVVYGETKRTFKELSLRVNALVNSFIEAGVKKRYSCSIVHEKPNRNARGSLCAISCRCSGGAHQLHY